MNRKLISLSIAAILASCAPNAYAQVSNGKVTTNPPTYANGATSPLSLTTDGKLRVDAQVNSTTEAVATAAPPTYVEGTNNPLSQDLNGQIRVTGTFNANVSAEATAADPTYSEGTPNPFSQDLDGNLRVRVNLPLPAGTNNIGDVDVLSLPSIPAGNNNIGDVDAVQSGTWNIGTVSAVTEITNALPAGTNNIGDVDVLSLPSIPAGNNNIGDVDVASIAAGNNNIGDVDVASLPALADQGTSNYSLLVTNSTSATNVKSSAGVIYEISLYNNGTDIAYLKLYNSASAPTCGSGTPVARYMIPGSPSGGAGSNIVIPLGKSFSSGIGFCITTGIANADTTAPAASTYLINLTYK